MIPFEKLKSLPNAAHYLRPGMTFQTLDVAAQCSDNDAALRLNQARAELFQLINRSQNNAA